MRLMTYNILEGGLTLGGRLDGIVDLIRDVRPDILALSECNGFADDGHRTFHQLEARLGMRGALVEARTGFHVAIFLREMQILESHSMTEWFHHGALRLKARHARQAITLMAAHLCPFSSEARVREAQYLASYVRERRALVMGDLNGISPHDASRIDFARMSPYRRSRQLLPGTQEVDTRALAVLESAGLVDLWHHAHPEVHGCTLPTPLVEKAPRPVLRLDYILATAPIAKKLQRIQVLDTKTTRSASDHFPIVADVDL